MDILKIYKDFPTQEACVKHLEFVRWSNIPACPYCKSLKSSVLSDGIRHHCNTCNTSYSVTVGTIFHKTKVDLQKWFLAAHLILSTDDQISVRQLAKDIGVNKNTACNMRLCIKDSVRERGDFLQNILMPAVR
jgi:transposase-like protein